MQDIAGEAHRHGVETGYHDALGHWREPDPEALRRIVDALSRIAPAAPPTVLRGGASPDVAPAGALLHAPTRAYQPGVLNERGVWVLALQLYGVRSSRNWGIGDFSDLIHLIDLAAEVGAAGVALNPLHALIDGQAIPYSPSSRLFLNPLYIDVAKVPGFAPADLGDAQNVAARLRATELVDYAGVAQLKMAGLRAAYRRFRERDDRDLIEEFAAFIDDRGAPLALFCAFQCLRARFGRPWWEWPQEFRRPTPAVAATLRDSAAAEMEFYAFVQWQADRQLAACQARARARGMPIGLYLDVAVGVVQDGADAWSEQDALMRGLSVGAPPDYYNPAGQNWGLASFHPAALVNSDFALFRATLRASMRYAGAIRLDHVLGLNRVYVVPDGCPASGGTYVLFPLQAMLAVVAQESVAVHCLVIGEDLGTVPDGFRDVMADWGIWSYRVALFERGSDGEFHPPERYPARALVSFNTHDLPTFAGWWAGRDLVLKQALGIDPGEDGASRDETRRRLGQALMRHGVAADDDPSFLHVTRFLARASSLLLVIAAEDVLGLVDQPNMPGTIDEHPNWRRKLPLDLDVLAEDQRLHRLGDILAAEGRSAHAR